MYIDREYLEECILELAHIIHENRELKEEVDYYKNKYDETNKLHSEIHMNNINRTAKILNKLLED